MPQSSTRSEHFKELFDSEAQVMSLKNKDKVHLSGLDNITKSLSSTTPHSPTLSKRIFIDSMKSLTNDQDVVVDQDVVNVSYCLDFHRAGTSPGLGAVNKPTILLYRCFNNKITSVWGMVDQEGLCNQQDDMIIDVVEKTNVWKLLLSLVHNDIPDLMSKHHVDIGSRVHFHNYDNVDVWG